MSRHELSALRGELERVKAGLGALANGCLMVAQDGADSRGECRAWIATANEARKLAGDEPLCLRCGKPDCPGGCKALYDKFAALSRPEQQEQPAKEGSECPKCGRKLVGAPGQEKCEACG
jgi:hypothetical protein